MVCEDCYWAANCPELGEVCEDFCSIYDEEETKMEWDLNDWYEYIAEYGDGNIEY